MTIGTRLHNRSDEFRTLHHFGNHLLTAMLNALYGTDHRDILSGYRAFSRRFLDHAPVISGGFEIETELLIQAYEHSLGTKGIPIRFRNRPTGSFSKLNSFRDGYRILLTMISLLRDHRPMLTFSVLALLTGIVGSGFWLVGFVKAAANPSLTVFRNLGVVLIEVALALLLIGLVLNTVNTRMREMMSLLRRRHDRRDQP